MSNVASQPLSHRERGRGEGTRPVKLPLPEDTLAFCKQLRSHLTSAEQTLWYLLRDRRFLGLKFRRQHSVPPYVLDFYCDAIKLAIELDGGQHNETAAEQRDEKRSVYLHERGIEVLRYWNHEVLNETESVLEDLMQRAQLRAKSLTPTPLPEGEGNAESIS